jgi:hypothetical protein
MPRSGVTSRGSSPGTLRDGGAVNQGEVFLHALIGTTAVLGGTLLFVWRTEISRAMRTYGGDESSRFFRGPKPNQLIPTSAGFVVIGLIHVAMAGTKEGIVPDAAVPAVLYLSYVALLGFAALLIASRSFMRSATVRTRACLGIAFAVLSSTLCALLVSVGFAGV